MSNGPETSNAAGWNVELSAETADRAEELLRDLATDAELEMAVLIEQSGGMIAGVATRQDVDVSTVGALVAGAFGALGALARELGESEVKESLHHGSGDTVYLREVGDRFVLLGVAPVSVPSGLVREKGAQVADKLTGLLNGTDEEPAESEAAEPVPAAAVADEPSQPQPETVPEAASVSADSPADDSPFQSAETGPISPEPESGPPADEAAGGDGFHTEISVEDDHMVTMPSMNPAVVAAADPEPAVKPDPKPEETGENPTYVFEIG